MRVDYLPAALAAMGLFAACHEPTADPARPLFSTVAATACPTPANVTFTNEAELRAALSAATPGEVIGLDGFFSVTADVIIGTPDVTLTCATPGSGIFPQPGFGGAWLLQVHATGVTVDRLILDGGAAEGPYIAGADAGDGLFVADGAQLTNNRVTCGSPNGECAFFVGTKHAVVADNRFESAGSGTGVHMQGGIDGTRVERNTIVTTAPPPDQFLGAGIRVRDGSNVVVADNVVRGPWRNSIATANLAGALERNDVAGALGNGIRAVGVHDVLFTSNIVSCGAESCALFQGAGGDTRTTIADNRFESVGSAAGVQLLSMDGARVERNTVVATAAAAEGILASGIAATGGANLVVTDNVVTGPWTEAALSFDGVLAARVERNRLQRALDAVDLLGSEAAQFLNNTVKCGGSCFFADGSPRAVIADNYFQSGGSNTGVHLQRGTDGDRVERNTIVATAPSTAFGFGGIRVRDGSNVVVADNVVQGPWSNSIATTTLSASRFENNTLQGAVVNGIRFNVGTAEVPIAMVDNIFQNNRASGAGDAGIFAQAACRNTFDGNDVSGNGGNIGAVFEATTGANVMLLPLSNRSVTIDNGFFDCNGDGRVDPNRIVGPGPRRRMPVPPRPDVVAGSSSRRYR